MSKPSDDPVVVMSVLAGVIFWLASQPLFMGCVMTACGFGTLVVAVMYLMNLGSRLHGNYEYFGNYPLLYLGPAAIGFVAPALVALIGVIAIRIWRRHSLRMGFSKTTIHPKRPPEEKIRQAPAHNS
jgi:hypothetical protein